MASALTVLILGCWLAGWNGASGRGPYPKPFISISPSGVIPLGGNIAIRCWQQYRDMRFLLYKDGAENYPTYTEPAVSEAEFPILSVSREQGGSYRCRYHDKPGTYSDPSDPVQIIVADPSFPRPSISLYPTSVTTLGADITLRCEGPHWNTRFFLHKAGDLNPQQHVESAGDWAEFHIHNVDQQHGGRYSCSYRPRSELFLSSGPSSSVELVVAEPSLPKPAISVSPNWGIIQREAITILCGAGSHNTTFLLYKDGHYWGRAAPVGDVAEFSMVRTRRKDAGSYRCSYHTMQEPVALSYPSDPVWLLVRDYTSGNIVRLALGSGVLLALALILVEAANGWRRGGS